MDGVKSFKHYALAQLNFAREWPGQWCYRMGCMCVCKTSHNQIGWNLLIVKYALYQFVEACFNHLGSLFAVDCSLIFVSLQHIFYFVCLLHKTSSMCCVIWMVICAISRSKSVGPLQVRMTTCCGGGIIKARYNNTIYFNSLELIRKSIGPRFNQSKL